MDTLPKHHAPCSPREYAAQVLAESSLERRRSLMERCPSHWRDLMERCPSHWRDLVEEHVRTGWAHIQAYRQFISGRRRSMTEGPQPAPRRDDTSYRISDFKKSAPEVGNRELAKLKALVGGGNGD